MKKISLLFVIILFSCKNNRENEVTTYPLNDLNIQKINVELEDGGVKSYNFSNDSLYLAKIISYLDTIKSTSMLKGKRLHGANYRGSVELVNFENNIVIIFNEHKDKGVVASFLKDKKDDNFQEALGSLYNADKLLDLIIENSK